MHSPTLSIDFSFRSIFAFAPVQRFSLLALRPLTACPHDSWHATPVLPSSCGLFFSLDALFRARRLCFHHLTNSFAKYPGYGYLCDISALPAPARPSGGPQRYHLLLVFVVALFSWSYELLFHKHLRCPMFFRSALCFSRHSLGTRHFSLANSFPCHTCKNPSRNSFPCHTSKKHGGWGA